MKSKFIFPIISIIQILMGVGLLLGVFLDPVGLMQPFFKGEITADLIFWTQGIIDVSAMHMIGVGLVNIALSNTFGFGGHNACVLFKKLN